MTQFTRKELEARYRLFNHFALADQRAYYRSTIEKYRTAASQVNRYRAIFAFLTGLSSAVAGFVVQAYFVDNAVCSAGQETLPPHCATMIMIVNVAIVMAVAMPVFGVFFSTLADLFQWDRATTIYESALENLEVADARSPIEGMDDLTYRASLRAFAEGTLQVMQDETAQWGQSIRTPPQLDRFIEEEIKKAEQASKLPGQKP